MKRQLAPTTMAILFVAITVSAHHLRADSLCPETAKQEVAGKLPLKACAFDLRDVRLLDGPFKHAMELDQRYLRSLDIDRLLHMFRVTTSLPSSAEPLGGWEAPNCEVRGHFLGHFLSACALMYASTGDERFKSRGDSVVAGLAECQAKLDSGYVSAFPESCFDALEAGKPINVAYYHVHKTLAGLRDMYVYCDSQQALEVYRKAADWVIARNAKLNDEQMQKALQAEHGGMNEVLADLYALTGEKKYLDIARRFNHLAVLEPASKHVDNLTGLHANTQFPKFIGAVRQYELMGDEWLGAASSFFWDTVVKERSYIIGGNSDGELFTPKEKLSEALGDRTTETCNTYNMLKLTRHLFCLNPRAEYADYYERALYNHILASQNPDDGMMCYYVALKSGMSRGGPPLGYCTPLAAFWCCTGTGVENHAKYGDSIYFRDGDRALYWNLFIASELNWKTTGLKLRQETNYPEEPRSRLVFACLKPTELKLYVRHPWWATAGFEVRVNGQAQAVESQPGSYVALSRRWADGDAVDVSMPFKLHSESFADNPRRLAFLHGPLVLCAEVNPRLPANTELNRPYPGIVTADAVNPTANLKPVAGRPSTFVGLSEVFRACDDPGGPPVTFEPFFKMHGNRRYVVYWDLYTSAAWSAAASLLPVPRAN